MVAMLERAIASSEAPAILETILLPETELAIWRRPVAPALVAAISATDLGRIDDLDQPFAIEGLDSALHAALGAAGHETTRAPLTVELTALARRFARVMDCEHLRIRVNVVETDACRKFHKDFVTARLLLTLAGPATQWIDGRDGDAAEIRSLAAGDVALVKGRRWSPEGSILHRSPPILGTGVRRLVVAIDPVEHETA
ncbi:DUF1826 domain-containing protein [Sphingomonas sp. PL-96]|uniref:DUF1826 domain-containing protein n=1 Tax=Sphingomonas sp. PL-96 TaxID=2887201 RepID=UPI001E581AA4|nr:DUF1826 domain-containing protein [Sphingomonas sp. PL-96]MCC2977095.1 DUF1826 domain-containing protein [Sphingomonas sp. PL-96]